MICPERGKSGLNEPWLVATLMQNLEVVMFTGNRLPFNRKTDLSVKGIVCETELNPVVVTFFDGIDRDEGYRIDSDRVEIYIYRQNSTSKPTFESALKLLIIELNRQLKIIGTKELPMPQL